MLPVPILVETAVGFNRTREGDHSMRRMALVFLAGFASCAIALVLVAATHSPTRALSERDVYYPASEDLAPDEMRVVALGTGMPSARPKQAAACWLVELGNGDKSTTPSLVLGGPKML